MLCLGITCVLVVWIGAFWLRFPCLRFALDCVAGV